VYTQSSQSLAQEQSEETSEASSAADVAKAFGSSSFDAAEGSASIMEEDKEIIDTIRNQVKEVCVCVRVCMCVCDDSLCTRAHPLCGMSISLYRSTICRGDKRLHNVR